jgi:uncharacterized membrane protein (DUF4010 family)
MTDSLWLDFAVALAVGLLIGLERERSKGEGPARRSAGIRTFALTTLAGAVAFHVGEAMLLAVLVGSIALLSAVSYGRTDIEDPGLTTDVGLILAPLLGGLSMSDPILAGSVGVAVAVIFAGKRPVHSFVTKSLTNSEFRDGLVLAIATLVVWPQLPDQYIGPFKSLNPHILWFVMVLVLAIGAAGHIATRLLGARYGLPISGFASGFISSTATIGSMAGAAAEQPTCMKSAVAGAVLSTASTFIQMALLLFVISKPTLLVLIPALAAGGMVALLYGFLFTRSALNAGVDHSVAEDPGRAFSIYSAFALVATLAAMLVVAAALKSQLGEAGIVAGAGVAGFIDTHSAAISIASLTTSGSMQPKEAVLPILVAMSSNAIAKGVMAFSAGSHAYALRIIPGLILSMAASWTAAAMTGLR